MMRRLLLPLLIVLVSLITFDRLYADRLHEATSIDPAEPTYQFAEWIAFTAHASGSITITQATVFYQSGSALPVSQPADRFVAAPQVDLSATIVFTTAKPAAFSTITYWWEVIDAAGNVQRSDARSIKYIDNLLGYYGLVDYLFNCSFNFHFRFTAFNAMCI